MNNRKNMKLIGLYDSPYVRRVAVTMRLYGYALPAFIDTPLE